MTIILAGTNIPTDEYNAVALEATDIGVECQAIAIQFDGFPNLDGLDASIWGLLRALEVDGSPIGVARVGITATAAQDGTNYYAPGVYAMLNDSNIGLPREKDAQAQCDTHSRALDIARRVIREGILQGKLRTYRTTAIPDTVPKLGQTVQITTDGFTGVLIAHPGWEVAGNMPIAMTLKLIDLSDPYYE